LRPGSAADVDRAADAGKRLVSHAPPDPLDRHQRRREQSIPTVSGALQLARGTALAAGALAEGDVQLAAHALARAVAAPGLGVAHEGLALSGDVYTSVLAIGRAAAPLAPSRNGPAFAESRL
jgi:hypothetical protein